MRNQLIVPNAELAINQLKEEIATELGIEINPEMKSRDAGRIGGEITKRLIALGKIQLQDTQFVNTPSTKENHIH